MEEISNVRLLPKNDLSDKLHTEVLVSAERPPIVLRGMAEPGFGCINGGGGGLMERRSLSV